MGGGEGIDSNIDRMLIQSINRKRLDSPYVTKIRFFGEGGGNITVVVMIIFIVVVVEAASWQKH